VDLFDSDPDIGQMKQSEGQVDPLAYRMAPRSIDEYVGQEHIVGKGKLLRRAIEATGSHPSSVWASGDRQDRPSKGNSG